MQTPQYFALTLYM